MRRFITFIFFIQVILSCSGERNIDESQRREFWRREGSVEGYGHRIEDYSLRLGSLELINYPDFNERPVIPIFISVVENDIYNYWREEAININFSTNTGFQVSELGSISYENKCIGFDKMRECISYSSNVIISPINTSEQMSVNVALKKVGVFDLRMKHLELKIVENFNGTLWKRSVDSEGGRYVKESSLLIVPNANGLYEYTETHLVHPQILEACKEGRALFFIPTKFDEKFQLNSALLYDFDLDESESGLLKFKAEVGYYPRNNWGNAYKGEKYEVSLGLDIYE